MQSDISLAVPWYLMAAYAYYILDHPILSDKIFDHLSKLMLKHWSKIDHFHKHLIKVDDLEAGTYLGEYPRRTICAANYLARGIYDKDKNNR